MKIYRKKKILLIFILMFTFSCRDTRPIYREFSPPLENRELNINIQSDKEIGKILRAQWYQYDENKLSDSKTIISTTFQNSNNASQYSRYENSGLKYHLKFQDTRTLTRDWISYFFFVITMTIYPMVDKFSHDCELSGFVEQEKFYYKIEIIEITYASLLLAFYTPAWDQEFNRPNISQYCVYSLLDQYIKFRNSKFSPSIPLNSVN